MLSLKKIFASLFVVLLLTAGGYWVYESYLAPQAAPTPVAAQAPAETRPSVVSAEGEIVPVRFVELSFDTAGLVAAVEFEKGDRVEAGQVIARLQDQERLAAAVTAAELELVSAEQTYDDLFENNTLAAAQAQKTVADARDAVRDAERRVTNLQTETQQFDIDAAFANLMLAKDRLDRAREDYEPYEKKPDDNPVRAALLSKLAQAQRDYNALERTYNNLLGVANEIDLSQAEADLALARVHLEEAEKDYELLQSGPDPDAEALAEARLANAQAQLQAARAALQDLTLIAPFTGTLVGLDLKVGKYVLPGAPALVLADLSGWQVETTDLAESDVSLLTTGMLAEISIDAFPDQSFNGEVRAIDLRGQDQRGDVTYTVTLDFDPGDTQLRWGMTAFVDVPLP
jgi:multidrug efflux pump subunit AcrA (membrane-fusion protein)